jgi:hypothetical protein
MPVVNERRPGLSTYSALDLTTGNQLSATTRHGRVVHSTSSEGTLSWGLLRECAIQDDRLLRRRVGGKTNGKTCTSLADFASYPYFRMSGGGVRITLTRDGCATIDIAA